MKSHRSIWKSSRLNHFHLVLITSGPHSAIFIYSFIFPGRTAQAPPEENLPALWHRLDENTAEFLFGGSAENIFVLHPITFAFSLFFSLPPRRTLWSFDIFPL